MALTASMFLALTLSTAATSEAGTAASPSAPAPVVTAPSAAAPAPQMDPRVRFEGPLSDRWKYDIPESRPKALPILYATLAAVNALDAYSTRKALASGAYEANPLMRQAASNTGTMLAVKAAATVSTIYFTERTWKKNRKAAMIMAAAINGVTAAVVARNLKNARR